MSNLHPPILALCVLHIDCKNHDYLVIDMFINVPQLSIYTNPIHYTKSIKIRIWSCRSKIRKQQNQIHTILKHSLHRKCVYSAIELGHASSLGKWHTSPPLRLPASSYEQLKTRDNLTRGKKIIRITCPVTQESSWVWMRVGAGVFLPTNIISL